MFFKTCFVKTFIKFYVISFYFLKRFWIFWIHIFYQFPFQNRKFNFWNCHFKNWIVFDFAFIFSFFNAHALAQWLAPAQPWEGTCVVCMAGSQAVIQSEHAFCWWLLNLSFSPTSSLSPNVCPWSARDLPMVAPIFTGGHCKNAKTNCTCNFFSIFPKFWKIAIFFEKNRFF